MGVSQTVTYLANDVQLLDQGHRCALEPAFQRLAAEELHDDERVSVLLAEIVNRDDVLVIQNAGTRFDKKSLPQFRGRIEQLLDSHFAADELIFGAIHNAHASAAEFRENFVLAYLGYRLRGIHHTTSSPARGYVRGGYNPPII